MDNENQFLCGKNHTFDKSKFNYVNLLLATDKRTKIPGDNKLMVNARHNFLNKDYYKPLSDKLNEVIEKSIHNNSVILDAGCGEGYYTNNLYTYLEEKNIKNKIYGFDISKFATEKAAKRNNNIMWSVASAFNMPLLANSFDCVINVFSPYAEEEYLRVLKNKGKLFLAIPNENHLLGLKKAIYDDVFLNNVKSFEMDKFDFINSYNVDYTIKLNNNQDILDLFSMTPYFYKTSKADLDKLNLLESLETEISFIILEYVNG